MSISIDDVIFKGDDFEISDALKEITTKKINKNLIKHFNKWISSIDVIMKVDSNDQQIAEINVHVPKTVLNASAKTDDMYMSIDKMLHKIEAQLEEFKGRNLGHQQ